MTKRKAKEPAIAVRPEFETELIELASLTPHPRNYRNHTEDQLEHIKRSITEHGFYRNVVVARDGTILAGHGVVQASRGLGLTMIPVIRLDVDPDDPQAIRVLTGDNEISRLAETDDRQLTELLKSIKDNNIDAGLLGTSFDDSMLAALVFVTRPASEIESMDRAGEWLGMPEFGGVDDPLKVVVQFDNEEDRQSFAQTIGADLGPKTRSCWYPPRTRQDLAALIFEG